MSLFSALFFLSWLSQVICTFWATIKIMKTSIMQVFYRLTSWGALHVLVLLSIPEGLNNSYIFYKHSFTCSKNSYALWIKDANSKLAPWGMDVYEGRGFQYSSMSSFYSFHVPLLLTITGTLSEQPGFHPHCCLLKFYAVSKSSSRWGYVLTPFQ